MMSQNKQTYTNLPRINNRYNQLDTHEILKQEIYKKPQERATDFKLGKPILSAYPDDEFSDIGVRTGANFDDTELYFDSVNRDGGSDMAHGEIKWYIPVLNNSADITNCIQFHIGKFFFPKIYASSGHPEYFYYKRIFVEITNAPSSHAILGPNGNKFHFELEINGLTGQAMELIPIKSSFFLQRPMSNLSELTLRFSTPSNTFPNNWRRIPIPPERVQIVMKLDTGLTPPPDYLGYNPARFSIVGGETTSILGPVGSTGSPGIAVFITGFNSNDPAVNVAINDVEGIYVTNILNSTDFEIGSIDATTVTANLPSPAQIPSTGSVTMYIPKNRIAFPLRFTSSRNVATNYIGVSHE